MNNHTVLIAFLTGSDIPQIERAGLLSGKSQCDLGNTTFPGSLVGQVWPIYLLLKESRLDLSHVSVMQVAGQLGAVVWCIFLIKGIIK